MSITVDHFAAPGSPDVHVEPTAGHVVVTVDGVVVADSTRSLTLFERGHGPVQYLPPDDVRFDLLAPTTTSTHCPRKGDASYWSFVGGDRRVDDVAWAYLAPFDQAAEIAGHLSFYETKADVRIEPTEP